MARSDLHDPPSDADLLRDARRDPMAFRQLYDRHAERIHGFLLRRTRDADAAIDLTAETFAQAWIVAGAFHGPRRGDRAPWLFGIARHVLSRLGPPSCLERSPGIASSSSSARIRRRSTSPGSTASTAT